MKKIMLYGLLMLVSVSLIACGSKEKVDGQGGEANVDTNNMKGTKTVNEDGEEVMEYEMEDGVKMQERIDEEE